MDDKTLATKADYEACRATLSNGSRSFFIASLLLPARVRRPASALYAFCRLADDAVDLEGGIDGLKRMRRRLDSAYRGQPLPHPVDRAFADAVSNHRIPRELPDALFEGFAWDAEGRRYERLDDLEAYAARVAGTVGAMMAALMGAREREQIARACDLGIAMQLSNIARDVGEDAAAGRLYLPQSWMRAVGIEPEAWLSRPTWSPALARVIERLLAHADTLYERADAGIARLPIDCRPAIGAARHLYAAIGHEVRRGGLDPLKGRAVVPPRRKLEVVARALAGSLTSVPLSGAPPLPAAAFLVDATSAVPRWSRTSQREVRPWTDIDGRVEWVVDLFTRLEQREQVGR